MCPRPKGLSRSDMESLLASKRVALGAVAVAARSGHEFRIAWPRQAARIGEPWPPGGLPPTARAWRRCGKGTVQFGGPTNGGVVLKAGE